MCRVAVLWAGCGACFPYEQRIMGVDSEQGTGSVSPLALCLMLIYARAILRHLLHSGPVPDF